MKRILLSLFTALTALFTASATEVNLPTTEDQTWTTTEVDGKITAYTAVINGFTVSYEKNTASTVMVAPSDLIKVYKDYNLRIKNNDGEIIRGITINCYSAKYCVNITVDNKTISVGSTDTSISWTGETTEFLANASEGQLRITSIDVEYGKVATIAKPVFSVKEGSYYTPQSVEITSAAGTSIYYTTDGTTPSAKSPLYSSAITVDKSMTVQAVAIQGTETSDVASADYVIAESVANISEYYTKELSDAVVFSNAVTVVYQSSSYLVVKDESASMLIFGAPGTYTIGDIIPAGFGGVIALYGGVNELKSENSLFKTATAGTAPEAKEFTANYISENISSNLYELVRINNATIAGVSGNNFTITDASLAAGTTLTGYKRFSEVSVTAGKYDIIGIAAYYSNKAQVWPITLISATGVESALNNKVTVAGGNGSISVLGQAKDIKVYNINGTLVSSNAAQVECATGLYIVVVDGKASKVVVR